MAENLSLKEANLVAQASVSRSLFNSILTAFKSLLNKVLVVFYVPRKF